MRETAGCSYEGDMLHSLVGRELTGRREGSASEWGVSEAREAVAFRALGEEWLQMGAGMRPALFQKGGQEQECDWRWEGDKSRLDDGFHPSALARLSVGSWDVGKGRCRLDSGE